MTPIHQAWEELAVFAEGLRIGRVEGYPGLVRVGKMTQADADHGIAVATALAEIWRAPSNAVFLIPIWSATSTTPTSAWI